MSAAGFRRSKHARRVSLALAGCLWAWAPAAFADQPVAAPARSVPAPLTRDLGQGLSFFRAHELPADLPGAAVKPGPLVLDLRNTTANDGAAEALAAWLDFRAAPPAPVFVLCNAATAAPIRQILAAATARPGLITLGPAAGDFAPDIPIDATDEEDHSAYEALEHGATLAMLLVENADKLRSDEAALIRERTPPATDATAPDSGAETLSTDAANKSPATAAPTPPIDHTLLRAIHLHRTLAALKRL